MWGIHRWPVNSRHKRPVIRKMFLFDDVIMCRIFHELCTWFALCYDCSLVLVDFIDFIQHFGDVIMSAMASQITGVSMVCTSVCPGTDQRKYHSSVPLAFVRGIHRWQVNSPHKGPVTQKMFPIYDIIMFFFHWHGEKHYPTLTLS